MEAAGVTAARVRWSAWLGVRLGLGGTWSKSLEMVTLAGDHRTTGERNVEPEHRMEVRKDQNPRVVEALGRPIWERPSHWRRKQTA